MSFRSLCSILIIILLQSVSAPAQLSKGYQILLNRGVQVQALSKDDCYVHLDTLLTNGNYTGVSWSHEIIRDTNGIAIQVHSSRTEWQGDAPGIPWARWSSDETNMPPMVTAYGDETPFMSQLVALQLGDEWNINDDTVRTRLVDWFTSVQANYPNTILYHNNWGGQIDYQNIGDYYNRAKPDMLCFDTYPWQSIYDTNQPAHIGPAISAPPTSWYSSLREYRDLARGFGIPFGIYRQTFHSVEDYDARVYRDPSLSELHLNTFGALAFGARYFFDFMYNTGSSSLFTKIFNGAGDTSPTPLYYEQAQINARARALGKPLLRLTAIDEATSAHTTSVLFNRGKDQNGNLNPLPINFVEAQSTSAFTDWVADRNDPYLRGWVVTNKGTKNNGYAGDVIIAWLKPLDESFDGANYTNEVYMMVVNGLVTADGTPADCLQEIKLNFLDTNGFTSVDLFNETNGLVETQVLPVVSTRRQLVLNLKGGDAALFKFSDGAPFVGVPPVITTQPTNRAAAVASSTTFAVAANGLDPIGFQWQFNGVAINGATGTNYTIANVQNSNAGGYSVIISNDFGSVTSVVATLTVLTPPTISTAPQDQAVIAGSNATFTVTATGDPVLVYQWRFNGTPLPGATAASYTVVNAQNANAGNYSVVVSNSVGTATSANALLTVNGRPSITAQPQSQACLIGGNVTFNVTAIGTVPLAYRWRKDGVNLSDGGSIVGATAATLTVNNVQNADLGTYTVLVTNGYGSAISSNATLSIAVQPTIQVQPQSKSTNGGATVTFTVTASGGGLNYQWRRAVPNTNIVNGGNITGATTDTLTLSTVSKNDATNYLVAISNAAGSVTSSVATLTLTFPMPWRDPFNYPAGDNLGGKTTPNGLLWADVGTTNPGPYVTVTSGNLKVSNLAPSFGNSIQFGSTGKSARLSFPAAITTGTTYYSFSLKVLDLTGATSSGNFIAGFNNSVNTQPNTPTVVGTRLYLRTTTGGFNLGVAKSTDTNSFWVWDSTLFTTNDTIFVVGSYTFNPSANDDVSSLWINPNPTTYGAANTPTPSGTTSGGADIGSVQLSSFVFFQRNTAPEPALIIADDLRIGSTWASVTPLMAPLQLTSASFTAGVGLQFQGSGDPANLVVQGSSNLINWIDLTNFISTNGTFQYIDSSSSLRRFYRAKVNP